MLISVNPTPCMQNNGANACGTVAILVSQANVGWTLLFTLEVDALCGQQRDTVAATFFDPVSGMRECVARSIPSHPNSLLTSA